jgi:hypothetical protein
MSKPSDPELVASSTASSLEDAMRQIRAREQTIRDLKARNSQLQQALAGRPAELLEAVRSSLKALLEIPAVRNSEASGEIEKVLQSLD